LGATTANQLTIKRIRCTAPLRSRQRQRRGLNKPHIGMLASTRKHPIAAQ